MAQQQHEDGWWDAVSAVLAARHTVTRALSQLDDALLKARRLGVTWDDLALATGTTRTTLRRWAAQRETETKTDRRLALIRSSFHGAA